MQIKRILWTAMIATVIVTSTIVAQAQSPSRKLWPRGGSNGSSIPVVSAPAAEIQAASKRPKKAAIVGSWLGVSSEGNRLITSFHSDGIINGSVQTEVSTNPELGVLTPTRGVWEHLGGREFGATAVGLLYDIDSGEYLGHIKARVLVTLDDTGDRLTGTDSVEIFGPDGSLVFAVPPGPIEYVRIRAEPFE
jgi:hypothetical protein